MTTPQNEKTSRKMSVCLITSSLEFGGAERQIVEMVRSFDRTRVEPMVVSLSTKVPLAKMLPGNGECLSIIEKRAKFDVTTILRLAALLRRRKIDVLHAFLFDAEIVARLAGPLSGVKLVVASERNTNYTLAPIHKYALRATRSLFDVMIANSEAGKAFNVANHGIPASKIEVVRNGVDVKKFHPDRAAGAKIRAELGIQPDELVIGMVGSFKRQKGHEFFLRMAAEVRKKFPKAWFLVLGEVPEGSSDTYRQEILKLAETLDLGGRCRFLGARPEMDAFYNSFDITVLLSRHEGTPNVVLESMASGVPVIATNVSDNALLISEGVTGHTVPVGDVNLAAERVCALLAQPTERAKMGERARDYMCREFSFERATGKMADIYERYLTMKCGKAAVAMRASDRPVSVEHS